jgi:hypothetical protein
LLLPVLPFLPNQPTIQQSRTPPTPTGCVHANCGFQYSIPPTKFVTNPFVRPAKADFLFGYTYSGFATLQKAVDDVILNNASTQGPVSTTVRTRA